MAGILAVEEWGCDPVFNVCPKLFVEDILKMEPYQTGLDDPDIGVYAYMNHPISMVDAAGIITRVIRRAKCNIYHIDDGTGVIACVCWKPDSPPTQLDLPVTLGKKHQELVHMLTSIADEGYEVGDLLHVRGKMKMFNNQRELLCSYHARIDDPNWETYRTLEQLRLYKSVYDKAFKRREGNEQDDKLVDIEKCVACVRDAINELRVDTITRNAIKQSIAGQQGEVSEEVFEKSLIRLQEDGTLYQHPIKKTYIVVERSQDLHSAVLSCLNQECSKAQYREKGCHVMHLLDVFKAQVSYARLPRAAIVNVLDKLEEESEIVGQGNQHYLPLDV